MRAMGIVGPAACGDAEVRGPSSKDTLPLSYFVDQHARPGDVGRTIYDERLKSELAQMPVNYVLSSIFAKYFAEPLLW